ncbi:endonuclease III [Candidatus Xiphinematobacter sp. Idaho Grape]|uniref:endonuclease III n=1 Tax=Candidatus Xiphinematobacter sp. Idaho Grape TaxID=1704307 RepID=UPI002A4E25F6|nr:endonuclease III [Candidatus Xiphinematobacter sp. Idaho Grape]
MTQEERVFVLYQRLKTIYPKVYCTLAYCSPFELLVATILSAQCTDKQVNLVTPKLFEALHTVHAFAEISQGGLESLIRPTGFFRRKAKNIRNAARKILECHGGKVPKTLKALVTLPGVGRKTANVVLGNAFRRNEGIAVDTHVARLSKRLELTPHVNPVKIEQDLMELLPRRHWSNLSHRLILHGRRCCTARRPNCATCQLRDICPSAFSAPPIIRAKRAISFPGAQHSGPKLPLSQFLYRAQHFF